VLLFGVDDIFSDYSFKTTGYYFHIQICVTGIERWSGDDLWSLSIRRLMAITKEHSVIIMIAAILASEEL